MVIFQLAISCYISLPDFTRGYLHFCWLNRLNRISSPTLQRFQVQPTYRQFCGIDLAEAVTRTPFPGRDAVWIYVNQQKW